jgi:endonuclease YncB( thermonuclease family)
MFLAPRPLTLPRDGSLWLLAAAVFAAGLTIGVFLGSDKVGGTIPAAPSVATEAGLRAGYPAEVLRVFDGDTFEARVRIWPGTDVTTKVRIRGIDAPEMKARCEEERLKAVAARDTLSLLLQQGGVAISNVGQDKYGGRVDADVSTRQVASVSETMLTRGLARSYGGGKRESWCDARN